MERDSSSGKRLYANRVQIVPTNDGAIVRRGSVRLHVLGEWAADVLLEVVQAASGPNGALRAEICTLFDGKLDTAIGSLVDELLARRLLVTLDQGGAAFVERAAAEDREDIFLWTFGIDRAEVARELSTRRLSVIGINEVSNTLVSALRRFGFGDVTVVDHPLLRSLHFCKKDGTVDNAIWSQGATIDYDAWADAQRLPDCLVTTSDFGGLSLMREWNELCVSSGITFYAAVLQDMTGYAGPFVLPGQTACFECFWLRQNSNFEERPPRRESEDVAFQGQIVDGYISSMAAVLGHIAAFEIFRFYASLPGFRSGVVEIDFMGGTMTPRKLLRAPRCPVCASGRKHAKIALERAPYAAETAAAR